jgi:hypothetical protein
MSQQRTPLPRLHDPDEDDIETLRIVNGHEAEPRNEGSASHEPDAAARQNKGGVHVDVSVLAR